MKEANMSPMMLLATLTVISIAAVSAADFKDNAITVGVQAICGVDVKTPGTPFYNGPLAEPYKNTPFEINWSCNDGENNDKFVVKSTAPSGHAAFGFQPKLKFTKVGKADLIIEACDSSVADTSDISNDNWCKSPLGPAATFKVEVLVMYVRREVRAIPEEERKRYFAAIHTMGKVPTAEGRLRYGPRFTNYYEINTKHAAAAMAIPCDLGHAGSAFFTYHRALTREFEKSVQAVDPSLTLPYWNMFLEGEMEDPSKSVIFSDEFYGNLAGNESQNWMVTNGQFAYWKVPGGEEAKKLTALKFGDTSAENWTNPYGFNRRPDNMNKNPSISRVGTLGNWSTPFSTLEGWRKCKVLESYADYRVCIDYITGAHTTGHVRIGGTSGLPYLEEIMDKIDCMNLTRSACEEAVKSVQLLVAVAHGIAYGTGCLVCDQKCHSLDQDPAECACRWQTQLPECSAAAMAKNCMESTIIFENPFPGLTPAMVDHAFTFAERIWGNPNTFMGEYQDTATSATDPIFWAQHSNIDRLFTSWRRQHITTPWDEAGFNKPVGKQTPENATCYGHGLHDPVGKSSYFNVFSSQANLSRAVTHYDMGLTVDTEILDVANADFIYDEYAE